MSYEGLWVNGMPVKMATKLVLTCEPQIEVIQGTPFNIEIHTVDEDGETIEGTELLYLVYVLYLYDGFHCML